MAEHSSTVQDLLLSNKGLFTADRMAVSTPFVKLHRKKYGDGNYLEYHSADNTLVNHHLSALKDKFTEWLTPWEVSMAQFSFHVSSSSLNPPMQTTEQPSAPTTDSVISDIAQLRSNIQTAIHNTTATDQRTVMTNFNDAHSELESIKSDPLELCLDL